jgi:DNA polymerase III subunit gamma/tau
VLLSAHESGAPLENIDKEHVGGTTQAPAPSINLPITTDRKNASQAIAPVNVRKDSESTKKVTTLKTVSLRKKQVEATEEAPKNEEEAFPINQPFTKEALHLAWYQFVETIQEDPHLVNAMKSFPPELLESYQIEVAFQNQALESKLLQLKPTLERFLHQRLKNNRIRMQLRMAEANENTRPYTSKDRLDYMIQKNPNLETLYRSLGLEI